MGVLEISSENVEDESDKNPNGNRARSDTVQVIGDMTKLRRVSLERGKAFRLRAIR